MICSRLTISNSTLFSEVSELIAEGKQVIIPTKGNSMLPFIRGEKDKVMLTGKKLPEVGDIVLAVLQDGTYVLHRIIEIRDGMVTLKGDGNLSGTEHCDSGSIIAVSKSIIRPSGKECGNKVREAAFWNSLPLIVRRCCIKAFRILDER